MTALGGVGPRLSDVFLSSLRNLRGRRVTLFAPARLFSCVCKTKPVAPQRSVGAKEVLVKRLFLVAVVATCVVAMSSGDAFARAHQSSHRSRARCDGKVATTVGTSRNDRSRGRLITA